MAGGRREPEISEALIKRAAMALCFASEAEVGQTLVTEGVDPEQAWLIVKAGVCYLRLEERHEEDPEASQP